MTPTTVDWESLQRAIAGEVILPGSPRYEVVRKPTIARFQSVEPKAVVQCTTPADVSATITFARRAGLHTAVRSGGHCFAGRSSTEGVVIDVTPLSSVSVEGGLARVGAGARLEALYDALDQHDLTMAAGCTSSVGIAGLALGGGFGILGRKHGLTCDHLLRAEIVLADGRVIDCDEHHHEELFWALRGAGGGNFGVVTSFVFRTLPAPATTGFHLIWPLAAAPALIAAWQAWAPAAPDELDATLRLTASADAKRPPVVNLLGAMLGTEADTATLLHDLVSRAGADPASASQWHGPYREAKRSLVGLGSIETDEPAASGQPPQEGHLYGKSEFFRRPLATETIAALVNSLSRGLAPSHLRELSFAPWGGAYNRVPTDATAFAHRDELFMIEHILVITPDASIGEQEAAHDWLTRSWTLVHPSGSGGVYPNFPDPDLVDAAHAYYGQNYERLLQVKAKYDPDNVFRFHQSLPSAAPGHRVAAP
ncbi:MAG: FAD-binding oxidoreductase [Gaiellaceae bacterium]